MRIGIFGGTFDPPHIGHLILAAESAEQLGLECVLWVLTPDPPHKQRLPISPLAQRLELVLAVLSGNPLFQLSTVEIDRPGPHYALETVNLLQNTHPEAELVYLIGGDSLRDLPTWYKPLELVQVCAALGVMHRPGGRVDLQALEQSLPGISRKIEWVKTPQIEISATDIRQRIASGRSFRYFLPPQVYELIQQKNYYR